MCELAHRCCSACLLTPPLPPTNSICLFAVAGLNIYDVLEPCYHGRNPYKQPSSSSSPDISDLEAEAASLQEAVAAHRGWPLLGGAKEGPVPGFVDLQLGHTPPCLDSRCELEPSRCPRAVAEQLGCWHAHAPAAHAAPCLCTLLLRHRCSQGDVGVLQRRRRAPRHPRAAD